MVESFKERVTRTNADLIKVFNKSLKTMLRVNKERGDCWRGVGLKGSFLEVRNMFFRARNLIWEQDPPTDKVELERWKKDVVNALEDLRNYTMLSELSVMEENWWGVGDDREFQNETDYTTREKF